MANRTLVTRARPRVGGAIFRAPVGTTLPQSAVEPLETAFEPLGYVSRDGLSNNLERSTRDVKAWGGKTVMEKTANSRDSFTFSLIEGKNAAVRQTVYGDAGAVRAQRVEWAWVLDIMLDLRTLKRIVIPRGAVESVGDVTYRDREVISYKLTISAALAGPGVYHFEYLEYDRRAYQRSCWESVLAELYARDAAGRMSVPPMTGSAELQRWMAANGIGGAEDLEAVSNFTTLFGNVFGFAQDTADLGSEDLPLGRRLASGSATVKYTNTDPDDPVRVNAKLAVSAGALSIAWTVSGITADFHKTTFNAEDPYQWKRDLRTITQGYSREWFYGTWRVSLGQPQWDTAPEDPHVSPWFRVVSPTGEVLEVLPGETVDFTVTPEDNIRSGLQVYVCPNRTGDYIVWTGNGTSTMSIPYSVELIAKENVQAWPLPSASVLTKLADRTGLFVLAGETEGGEGFTTDDPVKTLPLTLADAEGGTALGVFGGGPMRLSDTATSIPPEELSSSLLLSGNVEPHEVLSNGAPFVIRSIQVCYGSLNSTYPYRWLVTYYAFDIKNGDKDTTGGNRMMKDYDIYRMVIE